MMKTVAEGIGRAADALRSMIEDLVRHYSDIYRSNPPDSMLITPSGNYSWRPVSPEGRPLQAKALEEYRRFAALVSVLLRGQPPDTLTENSEALHGSGDHRATRASP
jgi:hypothetical protein